MCIGYWYENLMESDYWEDLDIGGCIRLLLHRATHRRIYATFDMAETGLTYRVTVTAWSCAAAVQLCVQIVTCAESI
jgi:hypothetical protein